MSKVTHTDVVLLLDASTQLCDYNRFEKIKSDSKAFCDTLVTDSNANIRCSIISFSSQLGHRTLAKSTNNVSEINTAIDNIQSGAGSYLAQAILRANDIMSSNSTNQKYYIIVSDGVIFDAYDTNNALATAKASFSNLKILAIGYNTESYGQDYLNSLVTPSTAEFNTNYQAKYTATNNIPDLEGAYNQICSQLIGHGINKYKSEIKNLEDLLRFPLKHCFCGEEYTDYEALSAYKARVTELTEIVL